MEKETLKTVIRQVSLTEEEVETSIDKMVLLKTIVLVLAGVQSDQAKFINRYEKHQEDLKRSIAKLETVNQELSQRVVKLEKVMQDMVSYIDPKLTIENYRQSYAVATVHGCSLTPSNLSLDAGLKVVNPGFPCCNDIVIKKLQNQGVEMRRELLLSLNKSNYTYNSVFFKFLQYMKIPSNFDTEIMYKLKSLIFIVVACHWERRNQYRLDPIRKEIFEYFGINVSQDTQQQIEEARSKISGKSPIERAEFVLKRILSLPLWKKIQDICNSGESFFNIFLMTDDNAGDAESGPNDRFEVTDLLDNLPISAVPPTVSPVASRISLSSSGSRNHNTTPLRENREDSGRAMGVTTALSPALEISLLRPPSSSNNNAPFIRPGLLSSSSISSARSAVSLEQAGANDFENPDETLPRRQREYNELDSDNETNDQDENGAANTHIQKRQRKQTNKTSTTSRRKKK